MKRKGFTLIELLAVIVIIAVIALVTIPLIGRVIENSKRGALTASASGIIEAAEIYYSTKMMENPETRTFTCSSEGCLSGEEKLDYKGQVSEGRVILYSDGKVSICIEDGTNAALKLAEQSEITTEEGSCNYDSEDYSIDATVSKTKYNELQEELNNWRKEIATAITNKGVITSETATLEEMTNNINSISTGDITKKELLEALQYSGLLTEEMTKEEILNALANEYPEYLTYIYNSGKSYVDLDFSNFRISTDYTFITPVVNETSITLFTTSQIMAGSLFGTNELIDLTPYANITLKAIVNNEEKTLTLNVADIQQECYIVVSGYDSGGVGYQQIDLAISTTKENSFMSGNLIKHAALAVNSIAYVTEISMETIK